MYIWVVQQSALDLKPEASFQPLASIYTIDANYFNLKALRNNTFLGDQPLSINIIEYFWQNHCFHLASQSNGVSPSA